MHALCDMLECLQTLPGEHTLSVFESVLTTLRKQHRVVCIQDIRLQGRVRQASSTKTISRSRKSFLRHILSGIGAVQKLTQVTGEAGVAQARDYCIQNTMRANENVERDLMSPIMQPFMSGVLWKLAQSGWKNQMAMGMVKKLFGSCLGGKMPQLTGGTGQAQDSQYQQNQGGQYQQNQSGQYQQNQGGAFMQGQRF